MAERYRIVWTRAAVVDLDLILEYVAESSSPNQADKLYGKLYQAAENVALVGILDGRRDLEAILVDRALRT